MKRASCVAAAECRYTAIDRSTSSTRRLPALLQHGGCVTTTAGTFRHFSSSADGTLFSRHSPSARSSRHPLLGTQGRYMSSSSSSSKEGPIADEQGEQASQQHSPSPSCSSSSAAVSTVLTLSELLRPKGAHLRRVVSEELRAVSWGLTVAVARSGGGSPDAAGSGLKVAKDVAEQQQRKLLLRTLIENLRAHSTTRSSTTASLATLLRLDFGAAMDLLCPGGEPSPLPSTAASPQRDEASLSSSFASSPVADDARGTRGGGGGGTGTREFQEQRQQARESVLRTVIGALVLFCRGAPPSAAGQRQSQSEQGFFLDELSLELPTADAVLAATQFIRTLAAQQVDHHRLSRLQGLRVSVNASACGGGGERAAALFAALDSLLLIAPSQPTDALSRSKMWFKRLEVSVVDDEHHDNGGISDGAEEPSSGALGVGSSAFFGPAATAALGSLLLRMSTTGSDGSRRVLDELRLCGVLCGTAAASRRGVSAQHRRHATDTLLRGIRNAVMSPASSAVHPSFKGAMLTVSDCDDASILGAFVRGVLLQPPTASSTGGEVGGELRLRELSLAGIPFADEAAVREFGSWLNSHQTHQQHRLEELDLSRCGLSAPSARILSDATTTTTPSSTSGTVADSDTPGDDVAAIYPPPSLVLDSNPALGDDALFFVARMCSSSSQRSDVRGRRLSLAHATTASLDGLKFVVNALATSTHGDDFAFGDDDGGSIDGGLKSLCLAGTQLKDVGAEVLATHFASPSSPFAASLEHLDLTRTRLTSRGLLTIASSLGNLEQLRSLVLARNNFRVQELNSSSANGGSDGEVAIFNPFSASGGGSAPNLDSHDRADPLFSSYLLKRKRRQQLEEENKGNKDAGAVDDELLEIGVSALAPFKTLGEAFALLSSGGSKLEHLDLSECGLEDNALAEMAPGLMCLGGSSGGRSSLKRVLLPGSRLTCDGGVQVLCNILSAWGAQPQSGEGGAEVDASSLELLDLSGCTGIGDAGGALLSDGGADSAASPLGGLGSSLRELRLASCGLRGGALAAFVESALPHLSQLEVLDLSYNGPFTAAELAELLRVASDDTKLPTLRSISLYGCLTMQRGGEAADVATLTAAAAPWCNVVL